MLTRSLCMYPGYLRVVVLADMTVETCGDDRLVSKSGALAIRESTYELVGLGEGWLLDV